MKRKVLTILLACALSVSFTACGNRNTEKPAKSETSEIQTETPSDVKKDNESETPSLEDTLEETDNNESVETSEIIYSINDSASLKDWAISVTDVKIVDSIAADYGSFVPKEEGNKYIQVFVTVTNEGKQADTFLPSYGIGDDVSAKVLYSDGYEFSATNLLGYSNSLHDSTINPLSSQTGEIAFEIPSTVADSKDELLIQFSSGNDTLKFKIR